VHIGLRSAFAALSLAALACAQATVAKAAALVPPPVVHSEGGVAQLTLTAVQNPKTGLPAFSFDGLLVPPTIRVNPGDHIKIHYVNRLPVPVHEPFTNMTNLHFHGMKTSPTEPGDDVIDIMVMPGQSYDYDVSVPKDESPGLYWYHPHAHGESNRQLSGGMSGLIIVNGLEKYYPQIANVPQQVLILRDSYPQGEPVPAVRRAGGAVRTGAAHVALAPVCHGPGSENLTLNQADRPSIAIRPGETQLWRFANASANTFADIQVTGAKLSVIARDGEPIVYRDGTKGAGVVYSNYLVPPAGRVEFLITGPSGANATLRSLCVNTGPVGDIMPERVLADIDPTQSGGFPLAPGPPDLQPTRKPPVDIRYWPIAAKQTIVFTEDKPDGRYYINGQLYDPTKPAKYFAKAGTVEEWTVLNKTDELHAFHIHQIHFLVLDATKNGQYLPEDYRDTITVPFQTYGPKNVPVPGKVTLLMDFTDPVIRGTFVFHCHILEHEDGGMMQKITVR